ncbi:MAG TPA: hypothetical protein VIY56_19105 [Vicinamibacterales bacterium]
MLRALAAIAGLLLAAFHLWLFGHQVWTGQLDPTESVRWLIAVGLVGGLIALRRRGTSLLWDRKATATWVLAALLHGPALAGDTSLTNRFLDETSEVAVQMVGAIAGLALALAAARATRGRREVRVALPRLAALRVVALPSSLVPGMGFLPRPPPRV